MADVGRFVRDFQEVVYTVGPDTVRRAILEWLSSEHGAAFTDETELRFCAGDSIAVTTRFASAGEAETATDSEAGVACEHATGKAGDAQDKPGSRKAGAR